MAKTLATEEFERIIERVNEMLTKALPKITNAEAKKIVEEAVAQTKLRYLDPGYELDDEPEVLWKKAVDVSISRADARAKADGTPWVVLQTDDNKMIIIKRSRFEKEHPFRTTQKDVVYDTEKGLVK